MPILIVEDDPFIQFTLSSVVKMGGYEYDIATNGAEAVDFALKNEGHYELGIMDISMPIMNGLDATRLLRKQSRYFPILGYSSDDSARERCIQAGMDEFLVKPCPARHLLRIIRELTPKAILVHINNGTVSIVKDIPMNADELEALRELKKKGLTKLKLLGLERTFVVHKNIQNKISHDLIGAGKEVSVFIDRSPDEPGRCHLYKTNLYITKDLFLPEELEQAIREEDELASKFNHIADEREKYK